MLVCTYRRGGGAKGRAASVPCCIVVLLEACSRCAFVHSPSSPLLARRTRCLSTPWRPVAGAADEAKAGRSSRGSSFVHPGYCSGRGSACLIFLPLPVALALFRSLSLSLSREAPYALSACRTRRVGILRCPGGSTRRRGASGPRPAKRTDRRARASRTIFRGARAVVEAVMPSSSSAGCRSRFSTGVINRPRVGGGGGGTVVPRVRWLGAVVVVTRRAGAGAMPHRCGRPRCAGGDCRAAKGSLDVERGRHSRRRRVPAGFAAWVGERLWSKAAAAPAMMACPAAVLRDATVSAGVCAWRGVAGVAAEGSNSPGV